MTRGWGQSRWDADFRSVPSDENYADVFINNYYGEDSELIPDNTFTYSVNL